MVGNYGSKLAKTMKDVITLIDACCDVYDRMDLKPKPDGSTFCNEAVNVVATAMGFTGFENRMADEIMDIMANSPDWSNVPMEKAQDMANQGSLLIAGLTSKELGQDHGHVVTVRPGKMIFSGKWGLVPRVINVGSHNFIARAQSGPLINQGCGVNESFIQLPKFWVWRFSL